MTTFLILLLFAVIFLVAGGALLYFRNKNKQKAALMGQTETSNTSDVSELFPGTLVEVKGTLRCEEHLTSEMAGEWCAYYSSQVTREYLERDYDDDDVGPDRRLRSWPTTSSSPPSPSRMVRERWRLTRRGLRWTPSRSSTASNATRAVTGP